jgi:hypothetical protein
MKVEMGVSIILGEMLTAGQVYLEDRKASGLSILAWNSRCILLGLP